ncbi:hypothetical protein BKA63DRAFT_504002 [Paraphoma chrysanthemicola]|nr:hypothetical protein BKA63DRAFT_504002 [Paraphoma chrysanthemicola]
MDTQLAERQLIQEQARAEHRRGDNGGSNKGKGKGKLKRISSGRKLLLANLPKKVYPRPVRPTPLPSFTLDNHQAYVDRPDPLQDPPADPPTPIASDHPNATNHDVEVPDSQIELPAPAPTTDNAPMSPPMTSSIAIPASMPEKTPKKSKKKDKKRTWAEMDPRNALSEQVVAEDNGNNINGTAETVSPASPSSQRKRKRRKPHDDQEAGMEETEEQSPHALEMAEELVTSPQETPIATMGPRKKWRLLRKPALPDPIEDEDVPPGSPKQVDPEVQMLESANTRPEEVDVIDGPSQLGGNLTSRLKKAKPRSQTFPESTSVLDTSSASIESDPISDDNDDMNYAPPAHHETPPTAEDASPDGDEMLRGSTSNTKTPKTKKQKERKKRTPKATQETARPKAPRTSEQRRQSGRKRTLGDFESVAERSLNTVRQLNHPPDIRDGGSFTSDEEELIRRAIRDYQQRKNIETQELVDIIQWTDDSHDRSMHRPLSEWRQEELDARRESTEFWQDLQQIGLTRKFVRVKNHVRSHYHTYKVGRWTEEEDEEIQSLYKLHPNRWKLIAQILGTRSPLDVQNRWKDYVQFGENRKMQRWTEEEESLLEQAVAKVVDRLETHRAATQQGPLQVYTSADINWLQVAIEMGNVRSRLQCFVKWQRMKGNETIRPSPNYSARAGSTSRETLEEAPRPLEPRRKSEKSAASADAPLEHAKEPGKKVQKNSTPGSKPRSTRQPRTPGLDQMRIGDKHDLVEAIARQTVENEEDIDWHQIAAKMKQSWSLRTLQAAFKNLLDKVMDQGNLSDTVDELLLYLIRQYSDEERKDYYDPDKDIEAEDETPQSGAGEDHAAASVPKTKRKRKFNVSQGASTPRTTPAKQKKKNSVNSTPRSYKSNATITASDDE